METQTVIKNGTSETIKLSHNKGLVDVAIPLPLFNTFSYLPPQEYSKSLCIGMRVLVPFGQRRLTGYVIGFLNTEPNQEIKEICDVLDTEPLFDEGDLSFYHWAATYYHHPIGQTIKAALPQGLTTEYIYVVSITKKGEDLLVKNPVKLQGLSILRELKSKTEISLRTLEKTVGRKNLKYQIRLLTEKGLVLLSLKKKEAVVRIRKEKWFFPTKIQRENPIRGKLHKILNFIVEQESVSYARLKDHFGYCSSSLKALEKKGAIIVEEKEVFRQPPIHKEVFTEPFHELTSEQIRILKSMERAITKRIYYPFLLHGVTGSGKTEIYLRVMERVMQSGRQCLYLVPEISLTSQLYDRIISRLQAPIAMLHSNLTHTERFDAWRMIRNGDVKIVVGARSAIFASFSDLGLIIVDEEHDVSYKQDEKLRYNARDLALLKGKIFNAMVILGSATPSLESYYNGLKKKYSTGALSQRVANKQLPHVTIIDMKIEKGLHKKKSGIISRSLQNALEQRLSDGQQSLLFLNRRGFSPAFLCQQCGHAFKCPHCDVSLIHHRGQKKLCCHYCNFSNRIPEECPVCGSYFLTSLGWGTERLEKEIKHLFPDARVARMDRDTTTARGASRAILKDVYQGNVDILIGTQMIVKGYHLPMVTLVGVMCADQSLNFPDYRASERTFQLLTQVAGRAGRGDSKGEVFVQAYNPDHYSITCAQQHDYRKFYQMEMSFRKELGYPPFKRLINFRFEGRSKAHLEVCIKKAGYMARKLQKHPDYKATIEILGPAQAPWEKIQGRYRYQMLIKGNNFHRLRTFTSNLMDILKVPIKTYGARFIVDVDPLFIM